MIVKGNVPTHHTCQILANFLCPWSIVLIVSTFIQQVSAALAEKLDLLKFNEFKLQVRAILADVEDRLRDWSPLAKAYKAPMDGSGVLGASSCLCCDSRVRSVRDMQSMGFGAADKVFSPEKLPNTEGLLPSINRSPDTAAYNNAKLSHRKKDAVEMLRKTSPAMAESTSCESSIRYLSRYNCTML